MNVGELKKSIADSGLGDDVEVYVNCTLVPLHSVLPKLVVRNGGSALECASKARAEEVLTLRREQGDDESVIAYCLLLVDEDVYDEEFDDDDESEEDRDDRDREWMGDPGVVRPSDITGWNINSPKD